MKSFAIVFLAAALALAGCGSGGGSDPFSDDTTVVSGGALGKLADLGDLAGGSGPNWLYTEAVAINDAGQIVGNSLTAPSAFIWDPTTSTMEWLGIHMDFISGEDRYYDNYYGGSGTKPFIYSEAVAVNNLGWAIGNSNTGAKDEAGVFKEKRAFVSDGFTFIDLAPITDSGGVKSYSEAVAINDNGYVILTVEDGNNGAKRGYFWDGASTVTAPDGSAVPRLELLSYINGEQSVAVALNENNQAVVNSGNQPVFTDMETGFSQRIGTYLNDETARATDINDSAQIVGVSGNLGFFWEAGAMTRINSLGGGTCEPVAINNLGQVAGNAETASGAIHAFRWQFIGGKPVMTDLGTLGGTNSYVTGINDAGHIVGYSDTGELFRDATGTYRIYHAFYWAKGKMYDLGVHNDFYDFSFIESYPFSKAVGINADGTVAGNSTTPNQSSRGFTLTPPSPLP